ncbi:hypothetical protein [Sphingobacterium sp. DR205]|uniref:hypothetical protein n=1 Tax=Sphingobacterium sp. DR205 TaxID=2713573 RepID=UPI0019D231A3|nr:hypothetical protein [Sphingobacterium sp. DR205]
MFDPSGGWSWLGAFIRRVDSWIAGEDPGELRKFGDEWGYNTVSKSNDFTITSHFTGGKSLGRQFLDGTPVVNYALRSGDQLVAKDYAGASISLLTGLTEAFTFGYSTLWNKPAQFALSTTSAPIVEDVAAKTGYSMTSSAVRSALADRIGKRGFTEVGYQFQKHFGRGGSWGDAISQGAKLNPATFNEAGYKTFQEIWKAPGLFQKVGGFLEKRLPDGRGIRLQDNWMFKGFFD